MRSSDHARRSPLSLPLLIFVSWFYWSVTAATVTAFDLNTISFDEGLSPLFGDGNLVRSPDDRSARLLLDQFTGSGFISSSMYQYGFFSAMIKLPSDYTAGVVVAFYTSNGDVFEKTHDELDIEFLGNIKGKPWRFQTNLYGNGSTFRGREERYTLWFDPSKDFHRYSILWNSQKVIFWVDDVPIREVKHSESMGGEYPQKPMSLYATIWDASDWATSGGKHKANYKYAPFTAEFKDFALDGCQVDPILELPDSDCGDSDILIQTRDYSTITPKQRSAMRRFRQHYVYYSYCYDTVRYPEPPPECVIVPAEKERFRDTGRLKFGGSHEEASRSRRRGRRRSRVPIITSDPDERR